MKTKRLCGNARACLLATVLVASFASQAIVCAAQGDQFSAANEVLTDPGRQCSNANLRGAYGLNFQGASDPLGRFASVSLLTFDGKGGFSAIESYNSQATGPQTRSVVGTYAVQTNCSFTLSEQNNILGQHADSAMCVLVDSGKQFYCVDLASGWQMLGTGTRI